VKEAARTYAEAREIKARRTAEKASGELQEQTRTTFREYATEWVERYHGRNGRGFTEGSRENYRRDLERYVFRFFPAKKRLAEITARDIANLVAWLCDDNAQARHEDRLRAERDLPPFKESRKHLADSTVRGIVNPVRSCLATAVAEGLIRRHPAPQVSFPKREVVRDTDGDEQIEGEFKEEVRALTREQLDSFLTTVHPRYRLLFWFLAATGLRISEAIGLQWRHLELNGSTPHVKVRRQLYRGALQSPKSKYGRRDVPVEQSLVSALRRHQRDSEWPGQKDLVFPAMNGEPLRDGNVRRRHLKPAAEEAGAPWAGFHSFRHTCATMLFDEGRNVKQVQKWLGHHSASFTLDTYISLMDGELGDALVLASGPVGASKGQREPQKQAEIPDDGKPLEAAA